MAAAAGLLVAVGARNVLFIAGADGILAGLAGSAIYLGRRRTARRMLAAVQVDQPDQVEPAVSQGYGAVAGCPDIT